MALYTVASGGTILAQDVDQIINTLTGAVNNPVSLAGTLAVTGATTLTGGVSGVMAATGNVTANGNRCVEGTAAVTHAEVYPAQGSNPGTASQTYVTVTLTFARSFVSNPAVAGGLTTGAGDKANVSIGSAVSTTAVTMYFQNTDASSQTLSNWSIMALGA